MRLELERLHLIEQQLLAGSPPAASWTRQLVLDPDLQSDAQAQQLAYDALRLAGQQQLRRELHAIHARLYGRAGLRQWLRRAGTTLRVLLRRPRGC